ncbi:MAG: sodium:proton antiporter [Clostridia bacterium]|nr:sodium:proton antiporter [Clostridia bacterium]
MDIIRNFPFISIVFSLFSAVVSSLLKGKAARYMTAAAESVLVVLSASTLWYAAKLGEPVTYWMGHFPAPWGNEIRFGVLEALTALVFALVLLFSVLGGAKFVSRDIFPQKLNLYYVLINLMGAALMALVYTNDIFTGYVFLEILTLTSGGILMIREIGRTALAATRYMILNLLGSGLFLLGIILLYDITGHLLMVNMQSAIAAYAVTGDYAMPLTVTTGLICVGLGIKSGLFPFHTWMPDTYGFATPTSASILSGLVSKGYIFLLIKIMYRVIGVHTACLTTARAILFIFGLGGMIVGSVHALKQNSINRMTAYSSAAQIGYIYMGIGLGGAGFAAAIFHILTHAVAKPLLFLSNAALMSVSGDSPVFHDLQGAGHRNRPAGVLFAVGAMSMIGIPFFAGFTSKLLFSTAAIGHHPVKTVGALVVLAISTILNTIYFIRTVIRIYTPRKSGEGTVTLAFRGQWGYLIAAGALALMNIALGVASQPIITIIEEGLGMFA